MVSQKNNISSISRRIIKRGGEGSGNFGHGGLAGVHGGSSPTGGGLGDAGGGAEPKGNDLIYPSDIDNNEFKGAMLEYNKAVTAPGVMTIDDFVKLNEGKFSVRDIAGTTTNWASIWLSPDGEAIFVPGEHRESVKESLDTMGILENVKPENEVTGGFSGQFQNWHLVQIAKEMGWVRMQLTGSPRVPKMNVEIYNEMSRSQKRTIKDIILTMNIDRFNYDFATSDPEGFSENKIGLDRGEFGWYTGIEFRSLISSISRRIIKRGGEGSGNFGHGGLKGVHGGSSPRGGGGKATQYGDNTTSKVIKNGSAELLEKPEQKEGVKIKDVTTQNWMELAQQKFEELSEKTREKISKIEKNLVNGTETIDIYFDKETEQWDEERQELHDSIVDKFIEGVEPQEEMEIVFTGGMPGSGKSSVLREMGFDKEQYVSLDSDEIKAMLPEYEGWNAGLVHEESSYILGRVMQEAIVRDLSILYDSTMKTSHKFQKIEETFNKIGYKSTVIFVEIPMEKSMDRALARFERTGRYVSPYYIATHDTKNLSTFEAVKPSVSNWAHWDNSVDGRKPVLIAQGAN